MVILFGGATGSDMHSWAKVDVCSNMQGLVDVGRPTGNIFIKNIRLLVRCFLCFAKTVRTDLDMEA